MARAGFSRDVEGMRGVAILAVVLFHAGVPGLGGGYVGVDVFYVISGFLITRLLWKELAGTGRLRFAEFYARRARRLLPSAVLVLLVTAAATPFVLSPLETSGVMTDAVSAALYVANYRFAWLQTDYLASGAGPSPVQHYWSLGVEEQYYLLWPVLLVLAARVGRQRKAAVVVMLMTLTTASLGLSLWLTGHNQPWAFFSLPTRAWELGVGGLVCMLVPRAPGNAVRAAVGWAGLTAVLASVVVFTETTAFPGTAALLPVLGTAAVLATADSARGPGLVLGRRVVQLAGKFSYTWYLWHWPVLILAAAATADPLTLPVRVLLAFASFVLAVLTSALVENPLRFSPRLRVRARRGLALAAGLTAVAVVVPVAVSSATSIPITGAAVRPTARLAVAHRGSPTALEAQVEAAVARATATTVLPSNVTPSLARAHRDKALPFVNGCHLSFTDVQQPRCRYGHIGSRTRVLLLGDSHAAQWFPGLLAASKTHNWQLQSWTKATCPPLELELWSPILHRSYRECSQWRAAALRTIRSDPPTVVVLGVARHYSSVYHFTVYGPEWLQGLRASVREIRAAGSQVVVLGPTPKPATDVPDCLSSHPDRVQLCERATAQAVDARGMAAERQVVQQAGGRYLEVSRWICGATTCPAVLGNQLVYRDDNHLTTGYAAWLAPLLAEEVLPRG